MVLALKNVLFFFMVIDLSNMGSAEFNSQGHFPYHFKKQCSVLQEYYLYK